jgi:para-nitrobenzyl esterase
MPAPERPTAATTAGPVRGTHCPHGGSTVVRFAGVPYAAPPTGERRWQPPVAPEPWTEPRDASGYGPAAPQPSSGPLAALVPDMEPGTTAEDCLTLNVWTPACDTACRPVLVWFHGGAFSIGASSLDTYDGTALAADHDVVVVSANYRLGALGWLALGLPGTTPNAGLLDQAAALDWVQQNIAAFGGDPSRVTIFGESAGGGSVLSLLGAPAARGRFHRAVVQSGATDLVLSAERAAQVRGVLAAELGIDPVDLAAWQAVPVDDLLAAQSAAMAKLFPVVGMMPWHPVADGEVLPGTWQELVAGGQAADVPLVIGTTRDEMALFAAFDPTSANLDADALVRRLSGLGIADPAGYLAAYDAVEPDAAPPARWSTITTDRAMWRPAVRYAEAHAARQPATWMYRFDWPAASAALGACHAIDIPFPFGAVGRNGWDAFVDDPAGAVELSRTVQALWVSFARDGVPSAPGGPHWPPYDPTADRATLLLGRNLTIEHDPRAAIRRLED